MRINWLKWTLLFVLGSNFSIGQSVRSTEVNTIEYPNIPQEQIFVHYNSTLLFAGEYMFYKVYNLNSVTSNLSHISKIAYVELINEDLQTVFRHKIRLDKSTGQGDYFIPTTVPSGNYKLIGYTNWMKNGPSSNFFQGDVAIINPYQSDQNRILIPNDSVAHAKALVRHAAAKKRFLQPSKDASIELITDKVVYQKRSKVMVNLKELQKLKTKGSYSLSVRKVDTVEKAMRYTTKTFQNANGTTENFTGKQSIGSFYPPELRGELMMGRVIAKDSASSVQNVAVAISIPGAQGYELKVVTTDARGNFYINLGNEYTGNTGIVQVLEAQREHYKIELDKNAATVYQDLAFNNFQIVPEMKEMIIERSVHNQIENGYFSIKPDSLYAVSAIVPLDPDRMLTYNLDDYTRFPTIRETVVEVIDLVWAKRVDKGEYVFQVQPYRDDYYVDSESAPLVIVDGIPVQNQTHLLDYNARNVKSISFIRDKYVIGPKIFQGVLYIETFKKEYTPPNNVEHRITSELFKPNINKKYYRQEYAENEDAEADRILDFRYQLLWEPNLRLAEDNTTINFYTSDVAGDFELCLEGFTAQGTPVAIKQLITVE